MHSGRVPHASWTGPAWTTVYLRAYMPSSKCIKACPSYEMIKPMMLDILTMLEYVGFLLTLLKDKPGILEATTGPDNGDNSKVTVQ
uniref:Uncharacterized protein n=1 Tax=Romanomermis culicivorax TaxID=13658 RepID=A0A915HZ19_ROMCU